VTKAEGLDQLERGLVMYEVSRADRPRIIAGFVFVLPFPRRLAGRIDPHELWDYRNVDGSKLSRQRDSMKGRDARQVEDLINGMSAAVDKHREAGA
jgi:hypothetical protein